MNADRRATVQLLVASTIAYAIVGLIGYLVMLSGEASRYVSRAYA